MLNSENWIHKPPILRIQADVLNTGDGVLSLGESFPIQIGYRNSGFIYAKVDPSQLNPVSSGSKYVICTQLNRLRSGWDQDFETTEIEQLTS